MKPISFAQGGATTVEYAVIIVLILLAISATIIYMVNPADPLNSVLPGTYDKVSNRVGNYSFMNNVNGN